MWNFKTVFFIISSLFFNVYTSFSQGTSCATAEPFCGSTTKTFSSSGASAPSGPDYGCMQQQPNSVWYYMQANTAGSIGLTIGGGSLDVDFAMWGPFTDQGSGCTQVMGGTAPIQSSWSSSKTENIGIGMSGGSNSICALGQSGKGATTPPAAQAGEYYIVLISNYSPSSGTITFDQTSGTGSTNCAIVNQCSISNVTANATCNAGSATISGTFTVETTISTGTLRVTSSCGGSQLFYPPFPSTPTTMNYSFNGGAIDGAQCTVKVDFSDDTSCADSTTVTKPTTVTPSIFTAQNSICSGSSFTLPSVSSNGISGTWSPAINNQSTTTYTFTPSAGQCALDTTMTVVVQQAPVLSANPMSQTICSGDWINVQVSSDSTGALYGWTAITDSVSGTKNGTGGYIRDTLTYTGTSSGTVTYAVIGSKNGCNSQPIYVTVTVNPDPSASSNISLSATETEVLEGTSTNLNVTMSPYIPGVLYSWEPPSTVNCTDCPNPIATPTEDTWYTVTVTNPQGCSMQDSIFIKYKIKCGETFIPTIFTPNQDGQNEVFRVYSRCLNAIELTVYDRWGARVFFTNDIDRWWDGTKNGKPMNSGTYIYRAMVTLIDGTMEELKGSVSLVR